MNPHDPITEAEALRLAHAAVEGSSSGEGEVGQTTEADRKDAREWLRKRWSQEWPNEGHVRQCADYAAYIRALQPSSEGSSSGAVPEGLYDALTDAWTDFLDANPDDLTSPSDLPDHALVTCDQMIDIVRNAWLALQEAALQPSSAAPESSGEEVPCGGCGQSSRYWHARSGLWNKVMGGPDATDDPGGILCPNCFIDKAASQGDTRRWIVTDIDPDQPSSAADAKPVAEIDAAFWKWLGERDLQPDPDGDGTVDWLDIITALDEHEIELAQPHPSQQADAEGEGEGNAMRWNLGPSDPLTFENYSGSVDEPTPSEWAVQAWKDSGNAYAEYMGDPDGKDDTEAARTAAALAIERAALRASQALQSSSAADAKPVGVTISCPVCDAPHIDEGEWATTRHHKTHQCQGCGHEWRPFPFATVGIAQPQPSQQAGAEASREAISRAIRAADDEFGYQATLSSLQDGVATYTLTMGETVETFTDNDDAQAVDQYQERVRQERDRRRAAAILTNLHCQDVAAILTAVEGIADDYQTSETHHPDHILIPKAKFDAILAALKTGEA